MCFSLRFTVKPAIFFHGYNEATLVASVFSIIHHIFAAGIDSALCRVSKHALSRLLYTAVSVRSDELLIFQIFLHLFLAYIIWNLYPVMRGRLHGPKKYTLLMVGPISSFGEVKVCFLNYE